MQRTVEMTAKPGNGSYRKISGKMRLLTLERLDQRTLAAKRVKQLIDTIEGDLGGSDHLSEGRRQLVQRAAILGAMIENHEALWMAGKAVDLSDYLAAINAQRRVLATLGLERRSRDVTPTLDQITEHLEEADADG